MVKRIMVFQPLVVSGQLYDNSGIPAVLVEANESKRVTFRSNLSIALWLRGDVKSFGNKLHSALLNSILFTWR